jgi:murein L,D-transpeptidase YcbB/YkuD
MGVSSHRRFAGPILFLPFLLLPSLLTPAPEPRVDQVAVPVPGARAAHAIGPEELRARLASLGVPDFVDAGSRGRERWKAVLRFYEMRGHRTAWVGGGRLTRPAEALIRTAAQSDLDGMDPAAYARLANEARSVRRASARDWADPALDLDIRISYALARYVDEMTGGRVDPRGKTVLWSLYPARADVAAILARASDGGLTDGLRGQLFPQHPQYPALRRQLERYREIARRGGWPEVEGGPMLRPGQRSARVPVLRARLLAEGELDGEDAEPRPDSAEGAPETPVYTPGLAAAVKSYQQRHGLKADGILEKTTIAALNVGVEARIRQIEMNLERWRWLPRPLGERFIVVNIPTFELEGYEGGRRALRMRVVTGTAGETPTPVFAEEMTHVVFSPYWNVPPNIAREEVAPAAWHNRSYLARNNFEVLKGSRVVDPADVDLGDPRLQFRQRPGPGNSLGLVKFLFPNKYNVYLHDTNAKKLFAEVQRDYSHGCIRVQQPLELAKWLLDGTGWSPETIKAAMHRGTERHVRLERPVPVYIAYFTAWVGDDGRVQFRPDVYRHDVAHEPLLPPTTAPPAPAPKVASAAVATAGL